MYLSLDFPSKSIKLDLEMYDENIFVAVFYMNALSQFPVSGSHFLSKGF
jgi:hypothetical protein